MPQPHSPLKTWQVWSISRRESVKSDWTKTAVVRYCSAFLSNTFTKIVVLVSAWVLCGSVPYSILCCGFVRLWSSINSVWFAAAVVSRSWLKKDGRPLSMTGRPCAHAQWKRRGCRLAAHISLPLLSFCSSVPPQQGSSCWWLEA